MFMLLYKAYKFRMYPNTKQKELLNQFLGSTRFIYNYLIKEKERRYIVQLSN